MTHTPQFVNAVEYSERYPNFEVLPHFDRASLKAGDVAKICVRFESDANCIGERFWVLIKSSDAGMYTGTVDNELVHTSRHGLKIGDLVSFDHRHIYDFERGPFQKKA